MVSIRKALAIAVLCIPLFADGSRADDLGVVASIKPVHALVAGVMGETGNPELLLTGAASPHAYQLRPSEARALARADLIVWVGEDLETFLVDPITNLGSEAMIITLRGVPGMHLLPNREGGVWEGDDHDEDHGNGHDDHDRHEAEGGHEEHDDHDGHAENDDHDENGDHDDHDHGEFDMHIWLDPENAGRIVDAVADALVRIDPDRAQTYRDNARMTRQRIESLHSDLAEQLSPVREQAFFVFHDAYQYFERTYGLNGRGTIVIDPSRAPAVRRIMALREALLEHDVRCVFSEPQFSPDLVHTVVEGTNVRIATLDPIGADIEPGPDAWFEIMQGLGDAVTECLGDV
ncbi:MAG: zinc ABC transporter substrate-binding protein [Paracoccaceae bacterium]|nr:zinc ABC transporter substrate-binding protein [Paracoccaceae bacterium]